MSVSETPTGGSAPSKNRNLLVRAISGFTLLPVVLFLIWKGSWWAGGLLAVAAAVNTFEYYNMVWKRAGGPLSILGIALSGVLPLLPLLAPHRPWEAAFWLLASFMMAAWALVLMRGPHEDAPTRVSHLVTGVLYGGSGMAAMAAVRIIPHDGLAFAVAAMTITWGNDTAAYFAGRFFGKRKLAPTVSPNKTWEGFFGGMAGSVGGMFIARGFFFPQLTVLDCLVLGLGGSILGPLGDLCESLIKRTYKVKDSGRSIPGHGGFLDRLDAMLFNALWVFLYVEFLRP